MAEDGRRRISKICIDKLSRYDSVTEECLTLKLSAKTWIDFNNQITVCEMCI